MVAIVARRARPAKRWQWSGCARSFIFWARRKAKLLISTMYTITLLFWTANLLVSSTKNKCTMLFYLILDNKPFRFGFSDEDKGLVYDLQVARFDIFLDKFLVHRVFIPRDMTKSAGCTKFLLLSAVACQWFTFKIQVTKVLFLKFKVSDATAISHWHQFSSDHWR